MSIALPTQQAVTFRRTRRLPIPGKVLVEVGQTVDATTLVAKAELPGVEIPVEVSMRLGYPPVWINRIMVVKVGDLVQAGESIAINNDMLGIIREHMPAPCTGYVESISTRTGTVMLRTPATNVQRLAHIPGKIVEIIPNEGVVIETTGVVRSGVFGVGSERVGPLRIAVGQPDEVLTPSQIVSEMAGAVIVAGSGVSIGAIRKAEKLGVTAIVVGSIHDSVLAEYLGYEISAPITGQESIATTLILTEGFGQTAMRPELFALLQQCEGKIASVNGTTHLRSELVRPEVAISWPESAPTQY